CSFVTCFFSGRRRREPHRPRRALCGIIAGRPLPSQIYLADVGRAFHRRIIDCLEGPTAMADDTNGGVDAKIFAIEVAGVGRDACAAKILPRAGKAHAEAENVFWFLVLLRRRRGDFLLQLRRLGEDRRKIVEIEAAPLTDLGGIERQRRGGAKQQRERQRNRRAAEKGDELAAFYLGAHSITSSARPSRVGGARPSVFL